jgi:flagellar assembly protein FliH
MSKPFSANDQDIKHWVLPEISGNIVGMTRETRKPQTVEEVQALRQQAVEDGRQEGIKKGLAEMQAKARQLANVFDFMANPLQKLDTQVEKEVTRLAIMIAQMLLRKECSIDAGHIQSLIHETLEYLPINPRNVRIRLNPNDIILLTQAGIELKTADWICVGDKTIAQGGCVVESDTSHIDATVENRVQQIFDQLSEHRPQPVDGDN